MRAAGASERREWIGQGRQLPGGRRDHAAAADPQDRARRIRPGRDRLSGGLDLSSDAGAHGGAPGPEARYGQSRRGGDHAEAGGAGRDSRRNVLPGHLRLRQGIQRPRGARARARRDEKPARRRVVEARPRPARDGSVRGAHSGLDRREGNRPAERSHHGRCGFPQPPAPQDEAPDRSERHLRHGRRVRRQPAEEGSGAGHALQHLYAYRPAPASDRHAWTRVARRRRAPGENRRPVFRLPRRRHQRVLADADRTQSRGRQVPAARVAPEGQAMSRGKFITLEGMDGAGKSTHVSGIADFLRGKGKEVVVTREPGGTPLGEKLRAVLLSETMNIDTETLLKFAARREHIAQVVAPGLAAGRWVVSDRFTDATYAYQGSGGGMAKGRISRASGGGTRPGADCRWPEAGRRS